MKFAAHFASVILAAFALTASADVVVTNLTEQNWQGRMSEAMGQFARARNQPDPKVYMNALETALYLATNCPFADEAKKLKLVGSSGLDLAINMERDGHAIGARTEIYLWLLKTAAQHHERPDRRFEACYLLARRECLVCPDADFPRAEAALKALFEDPKHDAGARLSKLRAIVHESLPFDVDVLATAAKIKEQSADPAVQLKYYLDMADYMSFMYGGWEWGQEQPGVDPLNPAYSYEARLDLMDKGIADPKVVNKIPLHFHKAWLLDKLERFAEAEQIYLMQTANTNAAERADAFVNYARFLEGRAARYYTPAWKPYLKQATAAYLQALAVGVGPKTPGNWGYRESAANCAIAAGDFNAARTVLDYIVAGSKGATNDFVRIRLGRIAWAERDYEGVVAFYPPVDSPLNIREQYPMEDRANVAKALKLLGREEELLKALEVLKNKVDRNWRSYYAFAYDRLKAKLGK